jgi:hypothetical protein
MLLWGNNMSLAQHLCTRCCNRQNALNNLAPLLLIGHIDRLVYGLPSLVSNLLQSKFHVYGASWVTINESYWTCEIYYGRPKYWVLVGIFLLSCKTQGGHYHKPKQM